MKYILPIVGIALSIVLFLPVLAAGYASEIKLSDCECKWYKSELIVWIDNRAEMKYRCVAIDAITEWQIN